MLSIEQYRKRVFDEMQNAEQWIKKMCEGYEEIIICSDHYPFGTDCPICFWIQKNNHLISYQSYDADWDLFYIDNLPNKIITSSALAEKGDSYFISYTQGKYGWKASEVEPFGFVKDKFKDKNCAGGSSSIFGMLIDNFSYVLEDDEYEQYLQSCEEDKRDIEKDKAIYNLTDFSRVVNDEYSGGLYLNLYVVARK